MNDSLTHRGALLYNYLTNKHLEFVSSFCYGSLKRKLRLLDEFNNLPFKVTSASTCTFRSKDFIYIQNLHFEPLNIVIGIKLAKFTHLYFS